MKNPFSLEGKTILVTGASSGIGKATAIACTQMGATVIITGRNEERLSEVLSELKRQSNKEHFFITADIRTEEGQTKIVENILQLDGFVSNAGIGNTTLIKFAKEEEIYNIWRINTLSHILLFKLLSKKKRFSKNVSIVFTASIAGSSTFTPGNSLYGMSKAAILSFSKYVAIEYAGRGIRCNTICPGMTDTPLIQSNSFSDSDVENDKKKYLLKRYASPDEIAYPICFLLSDASSFITGQSIIVDGGITTNH